MTQGGIRLTSLMFKEVPGGFVFRAPNPAIFGQADHYLVNTAQRAAIEAILPKTVMPSPRTCRIWAVVFVLAFVAVLTPLAIFLDHVMTTTYLAMGALILAGIFALHRSNQRNLASLQPILAEAPRTSQRIAPEDIAILMNQNLTAEKLLRIAKVSAASSFASAIVTILILIYIEPEKGIMANGQASIWALCTVSILSTAMVSYNAALNKRRLDEKLDSALLAPRLRLQQRLMQFGCAAVFLFCAMLIWSSISNEYSDFAQGKRHAAKSEYSAAVASYGKAIAANPGNPSAYFERGANLAAQGDHASAIEDFTKAIAIEPANVRFYRWRGLSYRAREEHALAISDFTKTIELSPEIAFPYLARAWSFEALNNYDRALADVTKSIELDPKSGSAYRSRGTIEFKKREMHLALADFSKSIEIDQKDASAYIQRGRVHQELAAIDRALADFTTAVNLNIAPFDSYAHIWRGALHLKMGKFDEAISDHTKAIILNAAPLAAYNNRAAVHVQTGARELAIADYNSVLDAQATTAADKENQKIARERLGRLMVAPR